ncbi:MAG TPA: DHHA1 domain-containing protein, partial [Planctomycetota bacterium]|nr:DHHA1 domain-containing protein [Planctomycetota bacterium]
AVLGSHVTQAGSVVEPDRLRFDFHHPKAMTLEERRKVEDWVNRVIFEDRDVTKVEMSIDDAKKKGALMFFGDKYGDRVRVVTVGNSESVELCGGTHLEHSATIGAMRITSESAIGSGVRRIEAVTGPGVVDASRKQEDLILELSEKLKAPPNELVKRLDKLLGQRETMQREQKAGQFIDKAVMADHLVKTAESRGDYKIVKQSIDAAIGVERARDIMDSLMRFREISAGIVALPLEKPVFIIGVREDLVVAKGLKAGDLAKEVGKACGGGGGGRELQAQAGASDPSKIQLGFDTFEAAIKAKLS